MDDTFLGENGDTKIKNVAQCQMYLSHRSRDSDWLIGR